MNNKQVISPSRKYVAVCTTTNFTDYYFRIFDLPNIDITGVGVLENHAQAASWYFLNRLDATACLFACIPYENFSDLKTVSETGVAAFTTSF